jgi:hypothetical protein
MGRKMNETGIDVKGQEKSRRKTRGSFTAEFTENAE